MPFVYGMVLHHHCYLRTVYLAKILTLSHALSCPHGAFPIIRHNEVHDLTACLMTEVCHDVQVEPYLHPLSGEVMRYRSAVTYDNARVDIRASGFWRWLHHRTFFDVCVFDSFAASNRSASLAAIFCRNEAEKCRAYKERVREVEHGSFTQLIFSSSGGMGKAAATTYKDLAHLLSQKWNSPYSVVMGWLQCSLGFSLLRSSITCICGLRSCSKHPGVPPAVDLAIAEGCLTANWANVDLALFKGCLDAGALERLVSVAGVIQLSST